MTITQDNYLELGNLFFNELAGSTMIATIVGFVIITYICVKEELPLEVTIAFNVVYVGMVLSYAMNSFVWMLVLFVVAILVYATLPKIFKR